MADSLSTKQAIAASFKQLIQNTSFQKITISDICAHCGLSRKSFYYHFKDKYDLVNWIFENEFVQPIQLKYSPQNVFQEYDRTISLELCAYFYNNRAYYSKIFKIKGQNCFSDYIKQLLAPPLYLRISKTIDDDKTARFCVDFCVSAAISSVEKWISEKDPIPPETFIELLYTCFNLLSVDQ